MLDSFCAPRNFFAAFTRTKGLCELLNDLYGIFCVKYYGGLLLGSKSLYKCREGGAEERCLCALSRQSYEASDRGFLAELKKSSPRTSNSTDFFFLVCFQRGFSRCSSVTCFAFCKCVG